MAKQYVVTGAYVTLKTSTPQGPRILGFYRGAPVPADVSQEQIDHHLNQGLIAEVADPAAVPASELFPSPLEEQEGPGANERVVKGEKQRAQRSSKPERKEGTDPAAKNEGSGSAGGDVLRPGGAKQEG